MNERSQIALDILKDALASDPRVIRLEQAERALEASENAKQLSLAMKQKEAAYEEATRYGGEGKKEQRELFLAKKALDENPLAREYLSAYQAVRILYEEIDVLLFGPYRSPLTCGGKHA